MATLSFEYFPPATAEARQSALRTVARLAGHRPDFVSVTYGAGGSDRHRTRQMVFDTVSWHTASRHRCPVMPHLTGIGHTRAEVAALLADYVAVGVSHILVLAGDPRPGEFDVGDGDFRYATDLLSFVREEGDRLGVDFTIAVAAFPEVHPRSPDRVTDRRHLADKLSMSDLGITQFFFAADHHRRMVDELADLGCTTPVFPGVIPVTNPASVARFAAMNGTEVPADLWNRLESVDGAERLRIACDEAASLADELLADEVPGIHLYTLNVPEAAEGVLSRLGPGRFGTTRNPPDPFSRQAIRGRGSCSPGGSAGSSPALNR